MKKKQFILHTNKINNNPNNNKLATRVIKEYKYKFQQLDEPLLNI